jgi:hypothetical protein
MSARHLNVTVLFSALVASGVAAGDVRAQDAPSGLPSARIVQPVTANGKPLPPGTYDIRITSERPTLPSGAPSETQRWIEFIAGGAVVAREVAEVIPDDTLSATGTSSAPPRAVVQLLKEGDFVRVSIREAGSRYLIYLPTGNARPAPEAVK